MPYHDLNVPFVEDTAELSRTVAFLAELDYDVIAINYTVTGPLPVSTPSPTLPSPPSNKPSLRILSRITVPLTPNVLPTLHTRLPSVLQSYSLLSLRPVDEKTLTLACTSLPPSLISLDLSTRLPFHFNSKHSTLSAAIKRGCRFEISYTPATTTTSSSASADPGHTAASDAHRNLISNATSLVRALRSRGVIITSAARSALAARAPADVINLAACVWGLAAERAHEALVREAGEHVRREGARRDTYRGAIGVVDGGEKPADDESGAAEGRKKTKGEKKAERVEGKKRMLVVQPGEDGVSKRELKRRRKAEMKAQAEGAGDEGAPVVMDATAGAASPKEVVMRNGGD